MAWHPAALGPSRSPRRPTWYPAALSPSRSPQGPPGTRQPSAPHAVPAGPPGTRQQSAPHAVPAGPPGTRQPSAPHAVPRAHLVPGSPHIRLHSPPRAHLVPGSPHIRLQLLQLLARARKGDAAKPGRAGKELLYSAGIDRQSQYTDQASPPLEPCLFIPPCSMVDLGAAWQLLQPEEGLASTGAQQRVRWLRRVPWDLRRHGEAQEAVPVRCRRQQCSRS